MTEKRQADRIDTLNLSYFLLNEAGEAIHQGMGRTLNLSEKGILLETSRPIDQGCIVVLTLGLADETLDIKAKATHFRELENGRFGTGLTFLDITETSLATLKQFFQSQVDEKTDIAQGT